MTVKIYIAGPITLGDTLTPDKVAVNVEAFTRAERDLQALGYETLNPTRQEGREGCVTWLDYMRASLRDIADCDGVALLPGWADSRGARLEQEIAFGLGLPNRPVPHWAQQRLQALADKDPHTRPAVATREHDQVPDNPSDGYVFTCWCGDSSTWIVLDGVGEWVSS